MPLLQMIDLRHNNVSEEGEAALVEMWPGGEVIVDCPDCDEYEYDF